MPTELDGPYLTAAALCERTIQESDGVLTLVRLVDKVTASPVSLPGATAGATEAPGFRPFMVSLSLVVALKAGSASDTRTVRVVPREPSGEQLPATEAEVSFAGDNPARGVNVVINTNLGVREVGLYWFDVFLNEQMLSRIPLQIEYQPAGGQQPPLRLAPESGE